MFGFEEKKRFFIQSSYLIVPLLLLGLLSFSIVVSFINYNHQRYISRRNLLNEDVVFFSHLLMRIVSDPVQALIEASLEYSSDENKTVEEFHKKIDNIADFNFVKRVVWINKNGRIMSIDDRRHQKDLKKEDICFPSSICWHPLYRRIKQAGLPSYAVLRNTENNEFFLAYGYPLFSKTNEFDGAIFVIFSIHDFLSPTALPSLLLKRYKILYLPIYLKSNDAKLQDLPLIGVYSREETVFFDNVALRFKFMVLNDTTGLVSFSLIAVFILFSMILIWSLIALRYDIKRRERIKHLLHEQKGFMKSVENCLSTAIFAVDLSGRIVHVNAAFCQLIGYSEQFLLNLQFPFSFLLPSEDSGSLDAIRVAFRNHRGLPHPVEFLVLRRSGECIEAMVYVAPLFDLDKKCIGSIVTIINTHEQKRLQKLMRWQQKRLNLTSHLVAVGETTSFLAHELNQPLGALVAYATAMSNGLDNASFSAEELREIVQKITFQSERASDIVRRVYSFVHRHNLIKRPVDLRDVVRRSVHAMDMNLREANIVVSFDLLPSPCVVYADETLLVQVLINLLKNSIAAMVESTYRLIEMGIKDNGSEYTMTVRDHGSGVPQSICHKIFDAFVTTSAEGMGLGLSICRTIIESHRGSLDFKTDSVNGTVFIVCLTKGDGREND